VLYQPLQVTARYSGVVEFGAGLPLDVQLGGGPVLRMMVRKLMYAFRNISVTSFSFMLIGSPPTNKVVFSTAILVYPQEFC
jgi:hypothetical protein